MPIEGYDHLLALDEIDAIYIPLPTGMHYEWVIKALNSNKHVLVEKSAGSNLEEVTEMVLLAKSKKLALIENFQYRFHSQQQFVLDLLKNNTIGEIRNLRTSFGFPIFNNLNNIRYDASLGGGALLDAGAYILNLATFLFGNEFEVQSSTLSFNKKFNVDWFGSVSLVNKQKNIVCQGSFGLENFYQCNFEIWGSIGKIVSTRCFTAHPGFSPTVFVETAQGIQEYNLPADNHFLNMFKHFNEVVKSNDFEKCWNDILCQSKLIEDLKNIAITS
jgi:predicted dehydrogenase